jgi:hypothetical protein
MTSIALDTKHVIETILGGYDELQNTRHLLLAGRLALGGAEMDSREKWAVDEVLRAAETKLDAMISAIHVADDLDKEHHLKSRSGAK